MSSAFHSSVTFLRWVGRIDFLQRIGADEIMVELHERAIAQFARVEVVILDAVANEGTADGTGCFVAVGTQPFAVIGQLVAGVDRRQRAWDPAGFQRVRRIGARTDGDQAEFLARFEDLLADIFLLVIGAPDFEARRSGHAVAQGADRLVADLHCRHVEELQLVERCAVQLLDHVPGRGPWIWKRHEMRFTGLPIGRAGERGSLMISTL